MAFPRSRSDDASPAPFWRRWRLNRDQRSSDPPNQESREDSRERLHRRASWAIGAFLVLVIVAVLAAGYKDKFWDPPRTEAGSVRGVSFNMGDLVQRIRIVQGITGTADLTTLPFEYLQRLLHSEILRQDASSLHINLDDDIVEEVIHRQHDPQTRPGQTTDPGQLEQEFRNNLQIYLSRTGLSEGEYRGIVRERLLRQSRYFQLGADIEDSMEQVEVEWIRLDVTGQVTAPEVITRLQIENFADVARSVGTSAGFADNSGYVGWVPRDAFKEIGAVLFGDEKSGQRALDVGAIGGPLYLPEGIYIVHKLSGVENRELTGIMRSRLNGQILEDWEQQRLRQGADEGWVKMNFNNELYRWVADQVNLSAPRNRVPVDQVGRDPSGIIGNSPGQR